MATDSKYRSRVSSRFEAILVGDKIKVWDRGRNELVEIYNVRQREQAEGHAAMLERNWRSSQ